ncbi:hypothetical protein ACQP3F_31635, partial [Escherichia coli]
GYIPANHLGKQVEEDDPEDTWQDEESFDSYGTLVLLSNFCLELAGLPSVESRAADLPVHLEVPGSY